jgi:ribose 5-phosphate isomerase B
MNIKITIASDHAGFEVKEKIIKALSDKFYMINRGCFSGEQVDYPDYAIRVANDISDKYADFGILICGSGIGVAIVANRFSGVRAVNPIIKEQVILSREHNDANVICFGARLSSFDEIISMLEVFLCTKFAGGRHSERLEKISLIDEIKMRKVLEG